MYAHNNIRDKIRLYVFDKLMSATSHHMIREDLLTRIQQGEWPLGGLIPAETDLAAEYGCARTTVNRALQSLAQRGVVIRKRKGGTRICQMPVRQAKFEIQIIREQIETQSRSYSHRVLTKFQKTPPAAMRKRLNLQDRSKALFLETLHIADEMPFAFETRWVNIEAVPSILSAPFDDISINEWLVQTVPFSSGDVAFSAVNASKDIAEIMKAKEDTALFTIDRTTWMGDQFITAMTLHYHAGFALQTMI